MASLQAGVGRCEITPAPGTPQGGWGAQTHQRGSGADMPFFATALVLTDGAETVAIIDADAIGFDREWTDRIVQATVQLTGLPPDRVRLSCTHTHSGPNTFRLATISEGRDMVESYLEALPQRIASAVWQAQQRLVPVRVAVGAGACEINVNRRFRAPDGAMVVGRNWQGAVDRTVRVIRFDDFDERPIATIVHYPCHGTIMGWQTDLFTPDFPGPMRQVVEREVGGTCLFLQGAAANIAPRRGFTGDLQVYRRLGTILGLEASRIAWELEAVAREERFTGVLQSGAPLALYEDAAIAPAAPVLRVVQRLVELPARAFSSPDDLAAEAAALRAEMNRLRRSGTEEEVRLATAKATQAGWRAEYAQRYHGMKHVPWELMGIRIGEIALLSVPGEPLIEIAQTVCERSPFRHTLFSGYSNGGFGYIPTRAAFAEGGYETEATPFSPEAADVLVEESVQLLEELAAPAASSGFEATEATGARAGVGTSVDRSR